MQETQWYQHSGIDPGQMPISMLLFVHRKTEPKNNMCNLDKILHNFKNILKTRIRTKTCFLIFIRLLLVVFLRQMEDY